MRLDDFDPNALNVEDQRGGGRGFRIGGGGGKIGCGTLVIALIAAVVFGVDPTQMLGGLQQMQQAGPEVAGPAQGGSTLAESCSVDAMSRETCNALSSLNKTWEPIFAASGTPFSQPKLVFYAQSGQSGCGAAQSAMGPFYCPSDNGIYIDTDFYREMEQKLGAGGISPALMSSRMNTATTSRRSPGLPNRSAVRRIAIRRLPTACRCGWNCRPIATPGSGPPRMPTGSNRATWKKG